MVVLLSIFVFMIIVFMMLISKKVAKTSYKNLYITDLTNSVYNSVLYNNNSTNNGITPKPILSIFYFNLANFIIKNKIIKNKKLDTIEKLLYESNIFIKRNYIKNTKIFDNTVYVDNYCRVIIIAKYLLEKNNYNLNENIITNFFNSFNNKLTYFEVKALKDAFKYELITEIGKIAKFVIYTNFVKHIAKGKFNNKYKDSVCYQYYYGKNTEDFEKFESLLIDNQNYDIIVGKYYNLINNKIKVFINCISTIKFIDKYNFEQFYYGYNIVKSNEKLSSYKDEKINQIFYKISTINKELNIDENLLINRVIAYSDFVDKDILNLLENKDKSFIDFITKSNKNFNIKKKL